MEEVQADHVRWLSTAQEKVAWCSDISGDKYAIEAKLATVTELAAAAPSGEQKVTMATQKWDLLKSAVPTKKSALEEKKAQTANDWKMFVDRLLQAK